jgi:hypothetical protein
MRRGKKISRKGAKGRGGREGEWEFCKEQIAGEKKF